MHDREIDAETALQHHLEDELNVRRLLGDGTELRLYGAGFAAGWEACRRYYGPDTSAQDGEAPAEGGHV